MKQKIKQLETLASDCVGDGQSPNLYFVTEQGVCVSVTRSFNLAYAQWNALSQQRPRVECALEDRKIGVIAAVAPEEEGSTKLVRRDDSATFNLRPNVYELVC